MKPLSSDKRYQELAEKWLSNTISPQEIEEFSKWYNAGQDADVNLSRDFAGNEKELKKRIFLRINDGISEPVFPKAYNFKILYAAAALIVALLSVGLYFYPNTSKPEQSVMIKPILKPEKIVPSKIKAPIANKQNENVLDKTDIAAGVNKAILTLGDGSKIILDDAKNGVLANQGGNSVLKAAEGELIYSFINLDSHVPIIELNADHIIYNTIETPKGGKFQVKLPDGSKVWLNAASSLRFPTAFIGNKREVELKGEAYFEVSHDSSKVFQVNARNQVVQVLGTHFNINAYKDEPTVNTTLLEGSVRVSDLRTHISQLLKPGEQSKLSEQIEVINMKNTNEAVAWKDGYFQFDEADIKAVMRQIERWYDVSIVYEGNLPDYRFGGEIERSLSLLQVLKILEKTKVHFRLEGREVTVMP